MLGEDTKAQQNFLKAIELAPNDSEIRQNWGWFLCTHGRARESIAEFELAVRNPLYKTPDVSLVNAGKCSEVIGERGAPRNTTSARSRSIRAAASPPTTCRCSCTGKGDSTRRAC